MAVAWLQKESIWEVAAGFVLTPIVVMAYGHLRPPSWPAGAEALLVAFSYTLPFVLLVFLASIPMRGEREE